MTYKANVEAIKKTLTPEMKQAALIVLLTRSVEMYELASQADDAKEASKFLALARASRQLAADVV